MDNAKQSPRLVAFDLDDTVLVNGVIPQAPIELLRQYVASGGILSTASGRPCPAQEKILERSGITSAHGFPQFLICADKFIHRLEGAQYAEESEWNTALHERWRRILPEIIGRLPSLSRRLDDRGLRHTVVGDDRLYDAAAYVPLQFESVAAAEAAMPVMEAVFRDVADACINRVVCFSAVTLKDAGKGEALRRIAQDLGLFSSQVLAVGDSWNDISMLDGRYGFRSAAVANAEDIVKAAVLANNGLLTIAPGAEGFGVIMRSVLDGVWETGESHRALLSRSTHSTA